MGEEVWRIARRCSGCSGRDDRDGPWECEEFVIAPSKSAQDAHDRSRDSAKCLMSQNYLLRTFTFFDIAFLQPKYSLASPDVFAARSTRRVASDATGEKQTENRAAKTRGGSGVARGLDTSGLANSNSLHGRAS